VELLLQHREIHILNEMESQKRAHPLRAINAFVPSFNYISLSMEIQIGFLDMNYQNFSDSKDPS
jgi:hypothetical protein